MPDTHHELHVQPDAADKTALPGKTSKGGKRAAAILKLVLDHLAREGQASLTLDGIARAAGITKGNLQYYYPTRAQLLQAALAHLLEQHRQQWLAVHDEWRDQPLECLKQLIAFEVAVNADETFVAQIRERWSLEARDAEMKALRDDWYRWVVAHYSELVAALRPELSEQQCLEKAIIIYSLLVGAVPFCGAQGALPELSADIAAPIEDAICNLVLEQQR